MTTFNDASFLRLARFIANEWSKDPSSKIGAVIVRPDNTTASMGVNGPPRGLPNDEEILYNREKKYQFILHAEENAINFKKEPLDGYTIYIYPYHPCTKCSSLIIQNGIRRVVIPNESTPDRWQSNFSEAESMLLTVGVDVCKIDLNGG